MKLEAQSLEIGYGQAIHSTALSFRLDDVRRVALIGPNGCGKSTLLGALCGEHLVIAGAHNFPSPTEVFLVEQEAGYPPHLSVRTALRHIFLGRLSWSGTLCHEDEKQVQQTIEAFHLSSLAGKQLGKISSGERQRVFLARAFLKKPRLLLLDEPTNHLDPVGASFLEQRLEASALPTILSTHSMELAKKWATDVLALNPNGVVFCGPAKEFFEDNSCSKNLENLYGGGEWGIHL